MLGYARPEELAGKPFSAFCDQSADECASIFSLAQRKKNAVWECVALKKTGARLCLRLNADLLADERGKPQYIRLSGNDVTRTRKIEERLRRLESQLRQQKDRLKKK
jgi:PAS domain-containing protein